MSAYCKNCQRSHAAWARLNDGHICGLCGTRERDPQVTPINKPQPNPTTPTGPLLSRR